MTDYLNRLAGYYLEVLKHIRSFSNVFLVNIQEGRSHQYVDLSLLQDCEIVLRETGAVSIARPAQSQSHSEDTSAIDFSEEEEDIADLGPEEDTYNIAFQRLRNLYQKHLLNPYEREFLYGYPFVVGQTAKGRRICAPLFTVPCTLEYDLSAGEIRVRLTSDELQFNSYALAQVVGEKDLEFLERTLLAAGYPSLPLTDHDMGGFLDRLSNAVPVVKVPSMWEWTLDRLAVPPLAAIPETKLNVTPCAAVLLVSRPQYYLRRDLEALQESPEKAEESVLSRFFDESMQTSPEDSEGEELELLAEQYLFPFESNPRQREVARAIERHPLVCVQGPPGTGKSQTICNLVCHLVASGKTVLVTSQKNKALEVVSDKLGKLKADYLSVTLLRDDTESKRMLANRLDSLDAHLQEFSPTGLRRTLQNLEKKRSALIAEIASLRRAFAQARDRENQQEDLYRRYNESRGNDILPDEILLPELGTTELATLMQQYVEAYTAGVAGFQKATWYSRFSSWAETLPEIFADPRSVQDRLSQIVAKLRMHNKLLSEPLAVYFRKRLLADPLLLPESAGELLKALENAERQVIERTRQHELVRRRYHNAVQIGELGQLLSSLPMPLRATLREALGTIDRCMCDLQGFHRAPWYSLFRAIWRRRILWKSRKAISTMPPLLDPQRLARLVLKWDVAGWKQEEERIRIALDLAEHESTCKAAITALKYPLLTEEDYKSKTLSEVQAHFVMLKAALQAIILTDQVKRLIEQTPGINVSWVLPHLAGETPPDAAEGQMHSLESCARSLPHFSRMKLLEAQGSFGQGLATWLRQYAESRHSDSEGEDHNLFRRAIEAYLLRLRVLADAKEFPEDTANLAAKLKDCQKSLAEVIHKLLSFRINNRLKQECAPRSVHMELETLRKALRRGKKNFQSFEKLKGAVDYDAVLKAFPCWIMSIEDVCRVFPLEAGLFDVLIVDESSQCHLMGALPLLYRARAAIVVGDEKQLGNADVMFLKGPINEELKRRFAIDALPRSAHLDAGTESLLTLANVWRDRPVFLNEHFRSLPEIIKFCNERFYTPPGLRIMTHGAKLPPDGVFEIRTVTNAVEEEDKINRQEAETLVGDLISLMEDPRYDGLSFGVLSLFHEQAAYIRNLLYRMLEEHPVLLNRESPEPLIASTVDGFQGDERDVILYSFRYAPNSSRHIFTIQRDPRRINVAFSRPRKKVICYISHTLDRFPRGLVRSYLEYVRNPAMGTSPGLKPFDSPFEEEVCKQLQARTLRVDPQYPACGFSIDLVVTDEVGRRVAVECDGQFHYDDAGKLHSEDLQRQEILERAGWHVVRVPSRRYWRDPEACIDEVIAELSRLPAPATEKVHPEDKAAAPAESPFAPEEEDREIEEECIPETDLEEIRAADEPPASKKSRKRAAQPPGEVPEIPKDPATWFSLARWAKQNGQLTAKERQFSYKVGRYQSNDWDLSDKMRAWAATIWMKARELGFKPPETGQSRLF